MLGIFGWEKNEQREKLSFRSMYIYESVGVLCAGEWIYNIKLSAFNEGKISVHYRRQHKYEIRLMYDEKYVRHFTTLTILWVNWNYMFVVS